MTEGARMVRLPTYGMGDMMIEKITSLCRVSPIYALQLSWCEERDAGLATSSLSTDRTCLIERSFCDGLVRTREQRVYIEGARAGSQRI